MNIEELEQIKQDIKAVYNVMYNFDDRLCDDMQERVKRIETLLTAYEKEIEELTLDLEEMTKSNNHKKENWVHKSILNSYVSEKESEQKERKAYIKGTNDAHELCNKKWEDKIKAKTIEIKNRQVKDEFITASQGKLNTIIDMESLLEKE